MQTRHSVYSVGCGWASAAHAACAKLNYEIASKAKTATGIEVAFVDMTESLGHMLEIYEKSDRLVGFYEMVRQASNNWDGRSPVRSLS